jgi:hypothetical protein
MKKIILSIFLLAPSISFAQTILSMINVVKSILSALYPVVLSIAIVYLAWQIIQYTIKGKGKDALDGIVWGIIGIAVIVGIQALANVLLDTFSISSSTSL